VQYRSLATEIVRQLPGTQPRVLLFTAAAAGSGTSTVLLNLAVTLAAQDGTRVVVVDAHPDRPSLASRLGVPAAPGLREALAGALPMAWCLQETVQSRLLALAAGRPAEVRVGTAPAALWERLRERADWVLIDAAAWPAAPEAAELADGCDAVYLVLRQHEAGTPATAALQNDILDRTGRLRGCVLTS
jgi:Mrp family chromosome partitioning ATPase